MGDETKFSEKWDFRRKENKFDDSSSDDDPDSNSTRNPIIHNPNLVLDPNHLENGTETVTRKQPPKTRKRRMKKDESEPQKPKQVRVRKPKSAGAKETKKKEETVAEEENKKNNEPVSPIDEVGMFMKTLIDELTASRESLMDWVKTELYGPDQNVASRPPAKKRAVPAVTMQRTVKKRMTKKAKKEEEEKESEKQSQELAQNSVDQAPALACNAGPLVSYLKKGQELNKCKEIVQIDEDELEGNAEPFDNYLKSYQEMNKPKEIAQNGGDQVQELDCNGGLLNMFLKSRQDGLGRHYFQQQGQEGTVARTEMDNEKSETVTNQKSVVLAIKAPILTESQKKTREANNTKTRSSGSEMQKDPNFEIPYVPEMSSLPSLQSFPVAPSMFPSSSQGIMSFASNNNNFQLRQPPVASHIPDHSEFQTAFAGGQGFGNSMFSNNGQGFGNSLFNNNGQGFGNSLLNNNSYLSGFPAAFQPNPISGGYNFPAQVNPAMSLQQRDNNNLLEGLRMAITRPSDGRFPESEDGNGTNSFSDYRTSSGSGR